MKEYNKIETLYVRDNDTKKLTKEYRNSTIKFLKDNLWTFTEKVDGTNIRIYWDGHRVSYDGRTDNAQIPTILLNRLNELFGGEVNEELFEQKFGDKEVILFGEGYGPKIQSGGLYRDTVDFILFDVMINNIYLERNNVEEIAEYFNIDVVPIVFVGTLNQGVEYVAAHPKSIIASNGAYMEGLVGRTLVETRDRLGNRNIVKIKYNDIKDLQKI